MRRSKCLIFLLFSFFLLRGIGAVPPPQNPLTANVSILSNWLPIIVLSVLASASIATIYYIIGSIMGNARVKAGAVNEYGQAIGTLIIIIIIIGIFNLFGNIIYTELVPKSTTMQICQQLYNTNIDFVSSNPSINAPTGTPTQAVCSGIIQNVESGNLTANIDYGLGAVYVIISNLTNQIAWDINATYIFESYTGFLTNLDPFDKVCWPNITCLAPVTAGETVTYSYAPFAGYGTFRTVVFAVIGQADNILYADLIQLLGMLLLLYGWPFLLAAGVILRSSAFTRRLGGLMMAMCITGLLIFPLIYLFEYDALTNVNQPLTPIGAMQSTLPNLVMKGLNPQTGTEVDYGISNINFYVYPRADYILNYNGCWPTGGNMLKQELIIAGAYMTPGYGLYLAAHDFLGSFVGALPALPAILQANGGRICDPTNVVNSLLALENLYGMLFVLGVILPLINILIAVAGIKGLSLLFGGDTNLIGLGRLV